jgi:hypothetical protein
MPTARQGAQTALFMIVSAMAARRAEAELDELQDRVVALLVRQGFDERASDAVFDELAAKYRTGEWPFRRKLHLGDADGDELED